MSYQAVIKNSSNNLVTSQEVGMQVSILQGNAAGSPVYIETQTPTTNSNGLVSLEIGNGTSTSDFSAINWADGPYYIKAETDPTGETNYTITSTSQLMSVPYALYAKTSGNGAGPQGARGPAGNEGAQGPTGIDGANGINGTGGINGVDGIDGRTGSQGTQGTTGATGANGDNGTNGIDGLPGTTYTAGTNITISGSNVISVTSDSYTIGLNEELGGYVFYVTPDGQHGLVATTQNQGGITVQSYDGQNLINKPQSHDPTGRNFTDWRMPTKPELHQMYEQRSSILSFSNGLYWSSTEDYPFHWIEDFGNNEQRLHDGTESCSTRAVRSF
jgi:hypothetical protein